MRLRALPAFTCAATLLILLGYAVPAQACTCTIPPAPAEAFDEATAVFAGTVARIQPVGDYELDVELSVSEVWKGPVAERLTVRTADNEAACGFTFIVGQEYLVYAYGAESSLWTNLCTRTRPLSQAGEDLAWLGEGVLVGSEPTAPELRASLSPAYPNPFLQRTAFEVTLPRAGCARLRAYDLAGRLVQDLPRAACAAGRQVIEMDLSGVPAGVYLVELATDDAVLRRSVTRIH